MIKNTLFGTSELLKASPERWGFRFAMLAAATFMYMKSGAPLTGFEVVIAALALGIAALIFEYVGAKNMAVSWFERSPGAVFGWSLLWAGAFLFSANNWVGAASDAEAGKATVQKAAYVSYDDSRKSLDVERQRVAAEVKSVADLEAMTWQALPKVGSTAIASSGAAKAILDAAKPGTNRHLQATRAYEDLKARERWGDDLRKARAQLASAREALKSAQDKAEHTKVTSSEDRTDLRMLMKYAGMSADTAGDFQSAIRIAAVSLFISLFAWLHIREAYKGKPRQPWFNWRGAITRARKLWDGTDHTVVNNHYLSTHTIRTDAGMRPVTMQIA